MVKSVLSVKHQGLTDWFIQRVSAIVMAIYSIGMLAFFVMHPNLTFDDWHNLFACVAVKIATIIILISLLFHAWVGMWTVFTDYVKCYVARFTLHTIVILALMAFFFAALLVLWGI